MTNKTVALIAAFGRNHVIGFKGKIPWHFPEDLKHFKELTTGHAVIMGRKTFEAIGHPLSERQNIVLSTNAEFHPTGCIIARTLQDALNLANTDTVFIIGGQQLFEQVLELAEVMYLTEIDEAFEGDAFFPDFDETKYTQTLLKTVNYPYNAKFKKYRKK